MTTTLSKVKTALRVSFDNERIDEEIQLYIDACKADLCRNANIQEINEGLEEDPLIQTAIILYVKSKFTQVVEDARAFERLYSSIKETIACSSYYSDTLGDY